MSLFGSSAAKPSLFGTPATSANPSGGLFGSTATAPTFGFGQSANTQNQPVGGGLFGATNTAQQTQSTGGGLFGNQAQSTSGNRLGQPLTQTQVTGSTFGSTGNTNHPQTSSLFGSKPFGFGQQSQQQPQPQQQAAQRPLDQTLRFGQSTASNSTPSQNGAVPLWEEGRGMGVYRSVPAQIMIIKDKWDPASLQSPLRTYLYQHVSDEGEALRYRPGPHEDENKWEEAVQKRPGPTWVPLVVRGFFELGKKAQIQMEAIQRCNMMLQEINASLDAQLDTHRQKVSTRLVECKRRHQAAGQRTLALAVKVQILRNRGYVMDNMEEELKTKLEVLERQVFDASLNAREQEIWARMLGIRDRAKRLKSEMDKITPIAQNEEEPLLDHDTVKAAKETLEAYDIQLRHLQKELQLVQGEFDDWEKMAKGSDDDRPRRR